MNTLTQNAPIALNIAAIAIHQDAEGRYSLNDLHKASGGDPKYKPANFLRLDTIQSLIKEIDPSNLSFSDLRSLNQKIGVSAIALIHGKGKDQGTYAVKELVYAYAMWISPSFMLKVIRTFDAVQSGLQKLKYTDWNSNNKRITELTLQLASTKDALVLKRIREEIIERRLLAGLSPEDFSLLGTDSHQSRLPGFDLEGGNPTPTRSLT